MLGIGVLKRSSSRKSRNKHSDGLSSSSSGSKKSKKYSDGLSSSSSGSKRPIIDLSSPSVIDIDSSSSSDKFKDKIRSMSELAISPRAKECSIVQPYEEFKLENCHPRGWPQRNNDCWLDSSMYALFSNRKVAPLVTATFNELAVSADANESGLALYASNYLRGIHSDDWSHTEDCKQLMKNNIADSLWEWHLTHFHQLDIGDPDEGFGKHFIFEPDENGNIGNGPLRVMFKFLSCVDPKISFLHTEMAGKFSERLHRALYAVRSKIAFVHSYKNTDEKVKLTSIRKFGRYHLQSVVLALGVHIVAITFCQGKAYMYDNQQRPRVFDATDKHLTYAEELLLIYTDVGDKTQKNSDSSGTRRR